MNDKQAYKHLIRVSSIIGSASIVNMLMGLLRMKAAAIILGPAGVGLIGLLNSLIATGSSVFGLGLTNAGTRRVASASAEGEGKLAATRSALFWGTCAAAFVGGLCIWLLRSPLASWLLENEGHASSMGWVAVGVALTVGSGSQVALIRGLQRVGDVAKVTAFSSINSSLAGVAFIYWLGEGGVFLFCVCAPAASFFLGHWYVSKIPRGSVRPPPREVVTQWRGMAVLGISFLVSGLAVTAGHLLVRANIANEIGADGLGFFHAAWLISTAYIGFLMQAMGNEYFPRIAASMADPAVVSRMANQQARIGLLITGPVLVLMVGFSGPALQILYAREFQAAASLLCLLIFGDLLKVLGMPLRYITMASGRGAVFAITEIVPSLVFVAGVALLSPRVGIAGAGVAYIGMQAVMLAASYAYAKWRIGFEWDAKVMWIWLLTFCALMAAYLSQSMIDALQESLVCALIVAGLAMLNFRTVIRLSGGMESIGVLRKFKGFIRSGRQK